MSNLDMILDEYAKRGILDGNAVERLSAAARRDQDAQREAAEMVGKIRKMLHRYYECDDDGNLNAEYDPIFSPADAVEEVHDIIGKI